MKSKITFLSTLALLITSSLCGCNSNNVDYNSNASAQVEKVEKIQDFNGSCWISDNEILGFGNSTIPKPEGPNITYPNRPVQVYNTLTKSKKSIDDSFIARFDSLGLISPDKKNVVLLSKSWAMSILNIESKKVTRLKNKEPFLCYSWLNNNELIYLALESETVHKYNLDGSDTKIKTLDKHFNSIFTIEDRIYLIQSISDNRNAVYYTDTNFSELHNLGEFDGYISFLGNDIILKKFNPASESTSSKAAIDTYNYSIARLDKNFKEKDKLIDENVEVIDVNENNILYFKNTQNKSQLYSMDITSKKTVELYSSTDPLNSYNNSFFGISSNHKQIFLNLVYNDETNKTDRYETAIISY